jgi:hypothetical protein
MSEKNIIDAVMAIDSIEWTTILNKVGQLSQAHLIKEELEVYNKIVTLRKAALDASTSVLKMGSK